MSMVQLKCQDCGASVDIDLDHMMAYCPYCGAKLIIDVPQLAKLLQEREKTTQAKIHEENETARTYYKTHQAENYIREKGKQERKDFLMHFGFVFIMLLLLLMYGWLF